VVPPSPQDSTPSAAPRRSIPPAPSAIVLCHSSSALALRILSVALDLWLSVSASAPPPPAPPPSVGPLESWALPPPWLLPLSAPLAP
ncbi:hypothetical protein M9458_049857, partial [Cirrhinus mrigala]